MWRERLRCASGDESGDESCELQGFEVQGFEVQGCERFCCASGDERGDSCEVQSELQSFEVQGCELRGFQEQAFEVPGFELLSFGMRDSRFRGSFLWGAVRCALSCFFIHEYIFVFHPSSDASRRLYECLM